LLEILQEDSSKREGSQWDGGIPRVLTQELLQQLSCFGWVGVLACGVSTGE
jgi:hypothetical protein